MSAIGQMQPLTESSLLFLILSGGFRINQHVFARLVTVFMLACTCAIGSASGACAQVVAFGASITAGKGVSGQEAYPARLEALLRSKGINVTVVNQGINGDTLQNMQNRMDRAVPQGTRVVILQVGAPNARQGREEGGNFENQVSSLRSRLEARGIRVVMVGGIRRIPGMSADLIQPDGIHPTADGQAVLADWLLPQVMDALK
jgi:acyl-CoA thioesterase I